MAVNTQKRAEDEAVEGAGAPPASPDGDTAAEEGRQWYVIHTYSGYENKVKANLEHRIESMDVKDRIFQVVIPTEEEIEIRDGQRRMVSRKRFPGYVLVDMLELKEGDEASNKAWYVVRNTPGVTGFVGGMGSEAVPVPEDELRFILREPAKGQEAKPKPKITFQVGQSVRVIDGPFTEFTGTVSEIHPERNKVTVLVSFFGRVTPVTLDFLQVEKM